MNLQIIKRIINNFFILGNFSCFYYFVNQAFQLFLTVYGNVFQKFTAERAFDNPGTLYIKRFVEK